MTPEEKAKELVNKMFNVDLDCKNESMCMLYPHAKQCALIAVDELIDCSISYDNYNATWASQVKYWQEVKQEIEKL